jgi:hypothetical protein
MLFGMAAGAQWNSVAIGRLDRYPTIGSRTHVSGLGWRRFATGDTGKLTDKSQVLSAPVQVSLRLGPGYYYPGDA